MKYEYTPVGVCSRKIYLEVNDGKVENIEFVGGCNGNLKGIAELVKGMDVIERLEGITCGAKPTSCPAQLAEALKEIL